MPEDVSVVGFDDHPLARMWTPPLTTVDQDFAGLGSRGLRAARGADGGAQGAQVLVGAAADRHPRERGAAPALSGRVAVASARVELRRIVGLTGPKLAIRHKSAKIGTTERVRRTVMR